MVYVGFKMNLKGQNIYAHDESHAVRCDHHFYTTGWEITFQENYLNSTFFFPILKFSSHIYNILLGKSLHHNVPNVRYKF